MEATTIRELYIQRAKEQEMKLAKELKIAKAGRQEEARMRQEEARMRQEEARMRQEAENKLKTAILSCYNQGVSADKIAKMFAQPLEFILQIIHNK
jgi:hypothetical protein